MKTRYRQESSGKNGLKELKWSLDILEPIEKNDSLLIYGGKEIVRLNKSLEIERAEELGEYAVLKNKLDEYFLPKKN